MLRIRGIGRGGKVGVLQNMCTHCAVIRLDHFKFASYRPVVYYLKYVRNLKTYTKLSLLLLSTILVLGLGLDNIAHRLVFGIFCSECLKENPLELISPPPMVGEVEGLWIVVGVEGV